MVEKFIHICAYQTNKQKPPHLPCLVNRIALMNNRYYHPSSCGQCEVRSIPFLSPSRRPCHEEGARAGWDKEWDGLNVLAAIPHSATPPATPRMEGARQLGLSSVLTWQKFMGWDVTMTLTSTCPTPHLQLWVDYSDPPEISDDRHSVIAMNTGRFVCVIPSILALQLLI